ncbi:hypothetical protein KIN20_023965 [Parelaphostrongylus tenuis]|uniref:Uncharacterized protein n=1 Tax=Parelaphostrongylus tenuis TaxID=148309 RepID=A0AAD5QW36_PARTN|nr:hypothetical protein KIN20_023965 [Parelaphostrongylus tenuis]
MIDLMILARLPTILISLSAIFAAVFGCGVIPQGQARAWSFTVSGFSLPVAMVYSTTPAVPPRVPGISTSQEAASSFVSRLIMQTVIDVLEQQGHRAGLPDSILSVILNQLMTIRYVPLECKAVTVNPKASENIMGVMMNPFYIIVDNTVTALCGAVMNNEMCKIENNMMIKAIDSKYTSIAGTLTTTNIVMANWSKEMWQSVLNRAVRMLSSGPLRSHFFSAVATVS